VLLTEYDVRPASADAGATWWMEGLPPAELKVTRTWIQRGRCGSISWTVLQRSGHAGRSGGWV